MASHVARRFRAARAVGLYLLGAWFVAAVSDFLTSVPLLVAALRRFGRLFPQQVGPCFE